MDDVSKEMSISKKTLYTFFQNKSDLVDQAIRKKMQANENELKSIKTKDSLDIMAFKLREALRISLEINQKFDIEDVLDIIFKDFCIGK